MSASAWIFYTVAKKYLMTGTIQLDSHTFKLALYTSAAGTTATGNITSVSAFTMRGSLTGEVPAGDGYVAGGKTLSATTWTIGESANEYRFDATAVIWTASGGIISNIRYGVIYKSGASAGAQQLLCYAPLTTAQFNLTDTNTLTVTPANPNGIFELN